VEGLGQLSHVTRNLPLCLAHLMCIPKNGILMWDLCGRFRTVVLGQIVSVCFSLCLFYVCGSPWPPECSLTVTRSLPHTDTSYPSLSISSTQTTFGEGGTSSCRCPAPNCAERERNLQRLGQGTVKQCHNRTA
jgi:hypothetical protein